MRGLIGFINEIAGILYVGGIASHIVIGAVVGTPNPDTAAFVYTYKELSAYFLILPGLALKIACDMALWFGYNVRANWMRIKLALIAFLALNAFAFLVPMMPELRALAEAAKTDPAAWDAFHALESREALIGMSNALPLALELILGAFKPRLSRERRQPT